MSEHAFVPYTGIAGSRDFGSNCRKLGFTWDESVTLYSEADGDLNAQAFIDGWRNACPSHRLHFIGVLPRQWIAAVSVWGEPDFTHERATWSCLGEIAGTDTVIFGKGAFYVPKKWLQHTRLMPHDVTGLAT